MTKDDVIYWAIKPAMVLLIIFTTVYGPLIYIVGLWYAFFDDKLQQDGTPNTLREAVNLQNEAVVKLYKDYFKTLMEKK